MSMSEIIRNAPWPLPKMSERAADLIGKMKLPKFLAQMPQLEETVGAAEWVRRGAVAFEEQRYMAAFAAWKKAAQDGDAEASYRIGKLYADGKGVVRNMADAVVWYTRGAEAGHIDAQFQLGTIYATGAGPAGNGADNWFKSASQRDNDAAQRNLGVLFANGIAVEKNLDIAVR